MNADGAILQRILDDTFPLWGEGLTRERYAQYNAAQLRTSWGARRLRRVALVERDRVLASAKRYDLSATLDGRRARVLGIGAVFTPPDLRGRGHAAALIGALSADAREEGASLALLFSEIGRPYYERLGFVHVPIAEATIDVRQPGGAPAVMLRSGDERDYPMVAAIQNDLGGAYRFALDYDADWVGYGLAKKRLLAGLGEPPRTTVEFFVVEEGGRAVAWLTLHVTRRRAEGASDLWVVQGCGDRDPSRARVGAMLQSLLAREPAASPPVIRGWWPARFDPPQVTLATQPVTTALMMMRPLDDSPLASPLGPGDVVYWTGDAF